MQTVRCPYEGLILPTDGFVPHIVREHVGSPEYVEIQDQIFKHAEEMAAELRKEAWRTSG